MAFDDEVAVLEVNSAQNIDRHNLPLKDLLDESVITFILCSLSSGLQSVRVLGSHTAPTPVSSVVKSVAFTGANTAHGCALIERRLAVQREPSTYKCTNCSQARPGGHG